MKKAKLGNKSKRLITLNVTPILIEQIEILMQQWGENRTQTISRCIQQAVERENMKAGRE